jgi:hypothetical protein
MRKEPPPLGLGRYGRVVERFGWVNAWRFGWVIA